MSPSQASAADKRDRVAFVSCNALLGGAPGALSQRPPQTIRRSGLEIDLDLRATVRRCESRRRRLDQLRADPTLQPWLLRAVVLRNESRMVGHIGFHSRPGEKYLDELAPGGVELGFTVFETWRRQGYAREASESLMDWAHRLHGVTRFVVTIAPTNIASSWLAQRLDFRRIGSHVDEENGPEEIFERRLGGQQSPNQTLGAG